MLLCLVVCLWAFVGADGVYPIYIRVLGLRAFSWSSGFRGFVFRAHGFGQFRVRCVLQHLLYMRIMVTVT